MSVKNLADLRAVFKNKIIPLLQEYFYEDYEKIDVVLNGNGMLEAKTMQDLKLNLKGEFVDSDKKVYRITRKDSWQLWQFIQIYDEVKAKDLKTNKENE